MKIKNDLIRIEMGDKQYDFNNLILDEYLKKITRAQLDKENLDSFLSNFQLKECLVKFDTPFENIKSDMDLHNQDFDICFIGADYSQNITEKQIIIQYDYDTSFIYDYKKQTGGDNVNVLDYYNRKITALGFNCTWVNDSESNLKVPVCAVLDTSNYNIYLQENQNFSVTRRDIITTDTLFCSNNKSIIPGPVHLAPYGIPQIINQPNIYNEDNNMHYFFNDRGYGKLYSIGLSSYPDYIDKEFIIGEDIQVENNGIELNINGLENYLTKDSPLFCSKNIYASSDLYPIRTNYKYVIFKYKIYQKVHSGTFDNVISTSTDTGYYYYQAIPISKFGKSNLKIKYERG